MYVKVLIENMINRITKNTESAKRRKTSFPKQQVEKADLHRSV